MELFGNSLKRIIDMKNIRFVSISLLILFLSCNSEMHKKNQTQNSFEFSNLDSAYDNFQQIWKQQTEDEQHRDKEPIKHDHIHMKFKSVEDVQYAYDLEFYKDRNNHIFVGKKRIRFSEDDSQNWNMEIDGHGNIPIKINGEGFKSENGELELRGDTLFTNGLGVVSKQDVSRYRLNRCRYFSGWLQYPLSDDPDSIYWQKDLELHDQGGMVELDIDDVDYTAELTQLVFAHKIHIMKLAIYDTPISEVGINSKSISYTWTNPEAKRLGINLRKIISGWTFIEDGYLSSNNLKQE